MEEEYQNYIYNRDGKSIYNAGNHEESISQKNSRGERIHVLESEEEPEDIRQYDVVKVEYQSEDGIQSREYKYPDPVALETDADDAVFLVCLLYIERHSEHPVPYLKKRDRHQKSDDGHDNIVISVVARSELIGI